MNMKLYDHRSVGLVVTRSLSPTPEPDQFKMHTHTYTEIYCFLSGKGTFHIEGNEYPLAVGDVLIMRPAEAHCIKMDPSVPYERIVINFDAAILSSLDPDNILSKPIFDRTPGTLNRFRSSDFTDNTYMDCLINMVTDHEDQRIVILINLIQLLQKLGAVYKTQNTKIPPETTLEQQIVQYINRHLHDHLDLEFLCEHFFISRAQLSRMFKKATGTSVGKYINVKRLIACRQLILKGDKPTKVCVAFGYRDYSTFYRAYVQQFGISPRDEAPE
jgi:AraC-like DNA-binding protein